ncbi:MAG: PQQ-binding-like beta-propeller repeat protein [bacterium]|nr:PQQ-binding-like beta-propeller repeat protein [bacterium]
MLFSNKRWVFLVASLGFFITGCSKKKSPPLEGHREAVLLFSEELRPDFLVQHIPVELPPAIDNNDWPQPSGEADRAVLPAALGTSLTKQWEASVAGGGRSNKLLTPPIVVDASVYVLDANTSVVALSRGTGKVLWKKNLKPSGQSSSSLGGGVSYAEGLLFATTPFAQVFALNPEDGTVVWEKPLESPVRAAPIIKDGRVFVLTINNRLEVFDAQTGSPLWAHEGMLESTGLLGTASPVVAQGLVIVPYTSGEVFALRVEDGRPIWTERLSSFGRLDAISSLAHIRAQPAIDQGIAYILSNGGRLLALDVSSGRRLWSREVGGIHTPAPSGHFVFVLFKENQLVCLTREGGHVRWIKNLSKYVKDEDSAPLFWTGPRLVEGRLVLTNSQGEVVFFRPEDGEEINTIQGPGPFSLPPIVAGRTLYVLSDGGDLTSYR